MSESADAHPRFPRREIAFLAFFALLPVAGLLMHRAIAPMMFFGLAALPAFGVIARDARTIFAGGLMRSMPAAVLALAAFAVWAMWRTLIADPIRIEPAWNFFLAQIVCAGSAYAVLVQPPSSAERVMRWAGVSALALAVLLAIEGWSGGIFRAHLSPQPNALFNRISAARGGFILVLIAFPAAVILWRARGVRWAAALLALTGVATVGLWVQSNIVAFAAGFAAFAAALKFPDTTLKAVVWLLIFAIPASPFIAASISFIGLENFADLPPSWLQRLVAWRAAAQEIAAAPLFGHGVDYARAMAAEGRCVFVSGVEVAPELGARFAELCPQRPDGLTMERMPLHPHNLFLQVWLELGMLGAGLMAATIFAFSRIAPSRIAPRKMSPKAAAAWAGLLAAALVYAAFEWSIWQVWRIAAFWTGASMAAVFLTAVDDRIAATKG